jgi:DNA-binding MurR/RpiR family transcriptional regulator
MDVYQQIEMHKGDLSPRELVIYDIVCTKADEVVSHTTTELAGEFDISQSTFSRFSRRCGFKSFADLRMRLFQALADEAREGQEGSCASFDPAAQLQDLVRATREALPDDLLDQLADLLLSAGHVYTSGRGMSAMPADMLAQQLLSQTVPVSYMNPSVAEDYMRLSQADDTYVVFSSTGRPSHVFPHVAGGAFDEHHTKVILVTHSSRPLPPGVVDVRVVLPTWTRTQYPYYAETCTSMMVFCDFLTAWVAHRVERETGVSIDPVGTGQ